MSDSESKRDEPSLGPEQPFVAHLVELRDRLMRALIAIGVAVVILALYPGLDSFTTSWRSLWWPICPKGQP